jgi:hypothetical protein
MFFGQLAEAQRSADGINVCTDENYHLEVYLVAIEPMPQAAFPFPPKEMTDITGCWHSTRKTVRILSSMEPCRCSCAMSVPWTRFA